MTQLPTGDWLDPARIVSCRVWPNFTPNGVDAPFTVVVEYEGGGKVSVPVTSYDPADAATVRDEIAERINAALHEARTAR